jgi:hypothetical protein
MSMKREYLFLALGLLAFTVIIRLVPHLPNATPVSALALVGGVYLGRRWALALPLIALLLSDLAIGFYDWRIMASVYGSFALIGMLSFVVRKHPGVSTVALATCGAPVLFYCITNFAVWIFSPWYAHDLGGLLNCYELGLPFLRAMFLGDFFYVPLFFGAFEAARFLRPIRRKSLISLPA